MISYNMYVSTHRYLTLLAALSEVFAVSHASLDLPGSLPGGRVKCPGRSINP